MIQNKFRKVSMKIKINIDVIKIVMKLNIIKFVNHLFSVISLINIPKSRL